MPAACVACTTPRVTIPKNRTHIICLHYRTTAAGRRSSRRRDGAGTGVGSGQRGGNGGGGGAGGVVGIR